MKQQLAAPHDYGIVIRRSVLASKNINESRMAEVFEGEKPLDENNELLSYGPHFGRHSMETFGNRLIDLGLVYWDDFFYFKGDFPGWISLSISYRDSRLM